MSTTTTATATTTALNTTLIGMPTNISESEKYCASCGDGALSQGQMAAEEAQRRIKELEAQVQFLKMQNMGSSEFFLINSTYNIHTNLE